MHGEENMRSLYTPPTRSYSLSRAIEIVDAQSYLATTISRQKMPLRVSVARLIFAIVLQQLASSHAGGREHACTVYSSHSLSLSRAIEIIDAQSVTRNYD